MIKVLVFLEADLPRVESIVNEWMDKYEVHSCFPTGNGRIVFILKERPQRGRPVTKKED